MPPRLNKRQQREQEELAALKLNVETNKFENEEGPSSPEEERAPAKASAFAAVRSSDFFLGHFYSSY